MGDSIDVEVNRGYDKRKQQWLVKMRLTGKVEGPTAWAGFEEELCRLAKKYHLEVEGLRCDRDSSSQS